MNEENTPSPVRSRAAIVETRDDLFVGDNPKSSLVIPKLLITKIWDHAREGLGGSTFGGPEVGGLIIGRRVADAVHAEEVIPLPTEDREGRSFQLAAPDKAPIGAIVESARGDAKLVVGYYRSRTRGEEVLRASDLVFLRAIETAHDTYRDDFRCCLVLAPKSPSMAALSMAVRQESDWTNLPPISLQLNEAGNLGVSLPAIFEGIPPNPAERGRPKDRVAPSPARSIVDVAAEEISVQPVLARSGLLQRRYIGWYAAGILVGIGMLWIATRQTGMFVARLERERSPIVEPAGTTESKSTDQVRQDREEPATGDTAQNDRPSDATPSTTPSPAGPMKTSKQVTPDTRSPRRLRASRNVPRAVGKDVGAAPPRVKAVVVTVEAKRVSAMPSAGASASSAAQLNQVPPNYIGPKAIQQPRPPLPDNVPSGQEVQVNIDVSVRGKVTKVTPIRWGAAEAPLTVWAVRVLSSWVFEPAKLDGQAVPSQITFTVQSK